MTFMHCTHIACTCYTRDLHWLSHTNLVYKKELVALHFLQAESYSLHYNANIHLTLHTFLLYLLYVPTRPILVISIHVNKAFQLFNLVLFVSSGTNTGGNGNIGIFFSARKHINLKYSATSGTSREMCSKETSQVIDTGFLMSL